MNTSWNLLRSLPFYLGLAMILSISGCRTNSQTPPSTTSSDAKGPSSPTTSESQGEADPGSQRSRRGRATAAAPGTFDFYLLNLSWSPEFCTTHRGSQECGHGLGFVVHGLWPQDVSGNCPENCSNAPGPAESQKLHRHHPHGEPGRTRMAHARHLFWIERGRLFRSNQEGIRSRCDSTGYRAGN